MPSKSVAQYVNLDEMISLEIKVRYVPLIINYMGIFLLSTHVKNTETGSAFRQYAGISGLKNKDCAVSDLILSEDKSMSLLHCLSMCFSLGDQCSSAFYVENGVSKTCHGCSTIYTTSSVDTLAALTGSVYYTKSRCFI